MDAQIVNNVKSYFVTSHHTFTGYNLTKKGKPKKPIKEFIERDTPKKGKQKKPSYKRIYRKR